MIAIPSHPCLPCDPAREAPMTYGELDARDNVATCSLRIRWSTGERAPGCGARIALCHGCGLRTRINGAPCAACGGDQKPEVVRVQRVEVRAEGLYVAKELDGAAGSVGLAAVDPAHARADVPGQGGDGPRRETKAKAPSKPRAPAKRVAKGNAASDGPTLPGIK